MGRSAKEYCRPNQVCDYGGPVANADESKIAVAGDKSGVKVKSEASSGMKRATAQQNKPKAEEKKPETPKSDDRQAEAGWQQIGKSGADIVTTYKARKAAGSSSSS